MRTDEFGLVWPDSGDEITPPATAAPAAKPATEPTSNIWVEAATDLGKGIVGGAQQAIKGVYDTVRAISPVEIPPLPGGTIEQPKGLPAQILRDLTQFGLGFVGGMSALRGVKLAEWAKTIIAGGLGTAVVADPEAPRLSNLIQKYPWLQNPIAEALETKEDDSIALSKFKAAVEDMLTAGALATAVASVKALRRALKGDVKGAEAAANEIRQAAAEAPSVDDALLKQRAEAEFQRERMKGLAQEALATSEQAATKAAQETAEAAAKTAAATKPKFTLNRDEERVLDRLLHHAVTTKRLEDIPLQEFTAFNPAHSKAMPETQEVVQHLADVLKPKLDRYMKDIRTHDEVMKLADDLGEHPGVLYENLRTLAGASQNMEAVLVASKTYMYSLARELRKIQTRIAYGTEQPGDKDLFNELSRRLTDVVGMTKAVQKGAARATSAGRIDTGERDLEETLRLIGLAQDEKEVVRLFGERSLMRKLVEAHNEYWIGALLGSAKSGIVNFTTNTIRTFLTKPAEHMLGALVTGDQRELHLAFTAYRALRRHVFDSLEMAYRAMKQERAILDPETGIAEWYIKAISKESFNLDGRMGQAVDLLGKVARIGPRIHMAVDEFAKQMNYRAMVEARATMEAADLVKAGTLNPERMVPWTDGNKIVQISEVEAYIQKRFQEAFTPSGHATDTFAQNYAREVTLTQDLFGIDTWDVWTNVGGRFHQFINQAPILRGTIAPFVRVATNILREVGDLTPPVAMLKKHGVNILTGANTDPYQRAMFYGKLTLGSMLWGTAVMLALEGRYTPSITIEFDRRARSAESGWLPYSVVLKDEFGKNHYIQLNRLDPYAAIFGLAADFVELSKHLEENELDKLAAAMVLGVSNYVMSRSFLTGFVESARVIGGSYHSIETASAMLRQHMASYIPGYVPIFNPDIQLKDIRTIMDAYKAKIPGLSPTVPPRRDLFGVPVYNVQPYPFNAINPFTISEDRDKVRVEIGRLARSVSEATFRHPSSVIGNVDLAKLKNAKGQSAYDRWLELTGKVEIGGMTLYQRLKEVMASEAYKNGTDGDLHYPVGSRIVMIRDVLQKYRDAAKLTMLKEFEQEYEQHRIPFNLREMIKIDKMNTKAMRKGRPDAIEQIQNFYK